MGKRASWILQYVAQTNQYLETMTVSVSNFSRVLYDGYILASKLNTFSSVEKKKKLTFQALFII